MMLHSNAQIAVCGSKSILKADVVGGVLLSTGSGLMLSSRPPLIDYEQLKQK